MKKTIIAAITLLPALTFGLPDYEAKSSINLGKFMAFPGSPVNIYAEVYNEVTNNTDKPIWVMVHYNLFIEHCGRDPHHWKVKVNPHGTWKDHWKPFKECQFPAGNFSVAAEGAVEGIDKPLHEESWSYSNVNVQ